MPQLDRSLVKTRAARLRADLRPERRRKPQPFGLKLRRFPKDEIKKRVDQAARILDIAERLVQIDQFLGQ